MTTMIIFLTYCHDCDLQTGESRDVFTPCDEIVNHISLQQSH